MNVPKLHHYLAEAYLKRFTDENGDLWVLDRRTADIRRQRPEVTAAERELYTLDLPEAPDRRVETLLAETVDGPGLRVIGAIAGGGELEEADRAPCRLRWRLVGAEKVIPLTSGIALLIRDMTDTPRVRYGMIDRDRIRRVNEVLVRQSERFSMAHSAPLLESIRRHTNLEPAPPLRVQVGGGPTSEGTPK